MEKWLDRHPEIKQRQKDIRITGVSWAAADGRKTDVLSVSTVAGEDIAGYDPEPDADRYEYWKGEDRYWAPF